MMNSWKMWQRVLIRQMWTMGESKGGCLSGRENMGKSNGGLIRQGWTIGKCLSDRCEITQSWNRGYSDLLAILGWTPGHTEPLSKNTLFKKKKLTSTYTDNITELENWSQLSTYMLMSKIWWYWTIKGRQSYVTTSKSLQDIRQNGCWVCLL